MSTALLVFGNICGGAAKVSTYLRAAAANPLEFINIARINKAQQPAQLLQAEGLPIHISRSLAEENNGAFYLSENGLVRVDSPFQRPPDSCNGRGVPSLKDAFASAARWAADQFAGCTTWLKNKLSYFSSTTFIVVAGAIVVSAIAGYFTFYYKAEDPILPPPNQSIDPSAGTIKSNSVLADGHDEDTMLCLVCMEKPRSHIFIPCGHMLTCVDHADPFINKDCPVCRNPITFITKVTLA